MQRQPLGIARHQRGQSGRDGKARLGQPDRRVQQRGPVAAAPAAMRLGHQGGGAGGAHAAPAHDRFEKGQRRARGILKQARRCGQWCGFAPVQCGDRAGFTIMPQQECAAAQTRGLRLDQTQNRLHRDHGIGRRATGCQHIGPGA